MKTMTIFFVTIAGLFVANRAEAQCTEELCTSRGGAWENNHCATAATQEILCSIAERDPVVICDHYQTDPLLHNNRLAVVRQRPDGCGYLVVGQPINCILDETATNPEDRRLLCRSDAVSSLDALIRSSIRLGNPLPADRQTHLEECAVCASDIEQLRRAHRAFAVRGRRR